MGRPSIPVSVVAASLITGLAVGTYLAQNIGTKAVEYVNHATDPSAVDVGWNILESGEFIAFDVGGSNTPVWVRMPIGEGALVISNG